MFKCERCGSGYNANYIGVENCPRCMLVDRVQAPLAFKMFKMTEGRAPGTGRAPMPSEAAESASPAPVRSAP